VNLRDKTPPEAWQFRLLLAMISDISESDLNWLIGHYGGRYQIDWWTDSYNRMSELIGRLEEDIGTR
jgi:hypothetical protein